MGQIVFQPYRFSQLPEIAAPRARLERRCWRRTIPLRRALWLTEDGQVQHLFLDLQLNAFLVAWYCRVVDILDVSKLERRPGKSFKSRISAALNVLLISHASKGHRNTKRRKQHAVAGQTLGDPADNIVENGLGKRPNLLVQ